MTYGLDTDFLVACEIVDHPFHKAADALMQKLLADKHDFRSLHRHWLSLFTS